MLRGMVFLCRPFGVSLGLFIVLNLALALKEPRLAANRVWLNVPLSEPWLSFFASLLGMALLAPHSWGRSSGFRLLQGGIFVGFWFLAGASVIGFYHRVHAVTIETQAPFPFSLLIAIILLSEIIRVLWWEPVTVPVPRPARKFFGSLLVIGACFVMLLAHIYTFGLTDYTPTIETADAVVVLGAKVNADGSLSTALEDRVEAGARLVREGKARYMILTGGIDASGQSEPDRMAASAVGHGVLRSQLIFDREGNNTYLSARNCSEICRKYGFQDLLVVSQYFHNARVKLIFERSGVRCFTVPANPSRSFRRGAYFLFRETLAYPFYLIFYH